MTPPWVWLCAQLVLSSTGQAGPSRRQLVWPSPVPASSIPAVDWTSVGPPLYEPPSSSRQATGKISTANKATVYNSPLPSAVDWRNRSGVNYITTAQDQGVCQSCWAFAVTALIETMIRIEHGIWSKRSEADVHDGTFAACDSTGNAEDTLQYVAGMGIDFITNPERGIPGIADWPCDPYEATFHPYEHCADRSGRATYIPFYQAIGGIEDQKRWLSEYGPIVATFALYEDFWDWKDEKGDKVYSYNGIARETGNHIALIVGYDDAKQAWLLKNSWGPEWGNKGFVYIAYDNANIDYWTKYGLSNVNPDPWSRKRHQSGNMMQSGSGKTHRNFELLVSDPGGGQITHISRDGDSFEWSIITNLPSIPSPIVGQPSIIGTSFNRDFHAVAVDTNGSLHQWVYSQSHKSWSLRSNISSQHNITGIPGLTQADDSSLVVVVKHADGSLNEWRQAPNTWTWKLTLPPLAAAGVIAQSGPSLVQSNVGLDLYNPHGNSSGALYAVALRTDGKMQLFSKEGHGGAWKPEEPFGSGMRVSNTPPVMIQDFSGTESELSAGKLRVVVAVGGQVQHWVRHTEGSTGSAGKWELVESVGANVRNIWSLVQGSFGEKMHMITEDADGSLDYWEWDGRWVVVERLKGVAEDGWSGSSPVKRWLSN
ncbi:hypothetical protein QBC44DRAFT_392743 [Cladorrhinum sp. PSN332]|nr:hypothetical protein QBC44DRAFT_392743 [Cladorrhinum sp. PSN332]